MSWQAQPQCVECWNTLNPDFTSPPHADGPDEVCATCERPTNSGIYVRVFVERCEVAIPPSQPDQPERTEP